VQNIATGELLADLHFMGDFGKAVVNSTQKPLTPAACPTQAADATGSSGIRMIPSAADGAVGYEPWRVDLKKTLFGFIGDFTVNNPDGIVICDNATCNNPVGTGASGTFRFFTPNDSVRGEDFGLKAGTATGEFYTDVFGQKFVRSGDMGAVRQYIKPGALGSVQISGIHCYDVYAWGRRLVCGAPTANPTDREGSTQAPN
jgi:hypothetical protein